MKHLFRQVSDVQGTLSEIREALEYAETVRERGKGIRARLVIYINNTDPDTVRELKNSLNEGIKDALRHMGIPESLIGKFYFEVMCPERDVE